jgi:hypothetical protein
MMYPGNLKLGTWDVDIRMPSNIAPVIDAYNELERATLDTGHMKLNCVALNINGQSVLVHLEKTLCDECGHEHDWCAVPEYVLGNEVYRLFVSKLQVLQCEGCGTKLQRRGVIWRAKSNA